MEGGGYKLVDLILELKTQCHFHFLLFLQDLRSKDIVRPTEPDHPEIPKRRVK